MCKLALDQFKALRLRSQAGHRGLGDAKDPVQDQLSGKVESALATPHQAQVRSSGMESYCVNAVASVSEKDGK
jgi:hypothetical protein